MTDGNGQAAPGTESGSQDSDKSFDDLISDFEAQTSKPKSKPQVLNDFKELAEYVREDRTAKQQAKLTEDLNSALDFVSKGDGLKEVPKSLLRGMMEAYAAEDRTFADAFQNRAERPAEWQAQLEKGRGWAQEQLKSLSPKTKSRDDIAAAKAAVAGTDDNEAQGQDEGPSVAEKFAMTDVEWRNYKLGRKAQAS